MVKLIYFVYFYYIVLSYIFVTKATLKLQKKLWLMKEDK